MRSVSILAGMILVVAMAGCGGSSPAPSVPGVTGGSTPTASASVPTSSSSPTSGPSATAGGAASLPDPCTLITKEEGATAVTKPVSDGVHELISTPSLGDGRSCTFKVAGGGDGQASTETFPSPGDLYDAYKLQQGQFGPLKNLAGVGDKAFTVGNGECDVVKGAVLLIVKLFPADKFKTDPEPRTIALCKQAAARL